MIANPNPAVRLLRRTTAVVIIATGNLILLSLVLGFSEIPSVITNLLLAEIQIAVGWLLLRQLEKDKGQGKT